MATLADSFLQDLEDLEDDEVVDDVANKKTDAAAGGDSDDEIIDAIEAYEASKSGGVEKVSQMLQDKAFNDIMDELRRRKDEQPEIAGGEQLTEEDPEYDLINRCNVLVREIDDEIVNVHRFVKDVYSKRFPELESIVPTPLEYMQVVQRAGNSKDLAQVDFTDILPNTSIMAITVAFSMSQGSLLPPQEVGKVDGACDEAFTLNDSKRDVLLYLESRMSALAPNLSALLGAALAAKLMTAAQGLVNLSRMPAQNIMLVGSTKKTAVGLGTASTGSSIGLVYFSDLVMMTPRPYQNRAIKLVAGKCALAARVDAFREATLGQVGTQLREKILESLAKAQEPPPAKQKKPLPAPDDRAKPKRGGKRFRRMKEKYGLTDFKKSINRVNFGPSVEEDVSQESFEMGYGTIKREEGTGYGSIRPHEKKQKDSDLKAIKRQRQAAAAGARDGMSSSLAFTPVQGIELANPLAAKEKKGMQGAEKYFANTARFVKTA